MLSLKRFMTGFLVGLFLATILAGAVLVIFFSLRAIL